MLYWKLIFRGILRHKKRAVKFFVLLSLCFMMVILSLSFQDSFYQEYLQLGINARNAHINIYSPESVWLKSSFTALQKDGLPLLKIDHDFDAFINGLDEVEVGTRIIEAGGAVFTSEGKPQSGGTITGVKASDFRRIFPGIVLMKGQEDISVKPGMKNIPFLRWDIQHNEKILNLDQFVPADFKVAGQGLETFKSSMIKDFPAIFVKGKYEGAEGTNQFIAELNTALEQKDLYSRVPEAYRENDDFDMAYIIQQIQTRQFEDQSELKNWNKRLIQKLYSDAINEVPEAIALNKPMGLYVKSTDKASPPAIIPIEFIGYCEGIPEFYGYNFIELEVLQKYLDVGQDECTSYLIRLKDEKNLPIVMQKVNDYIKSRGLTCKAVDYKYIGGMTYMPLAIAMSVIFKCVMFLFLLISIFFVSYTVKISLIRRRKEMGTAITLGMSRLQNIIVFLGENLALIAVAWLLASVIMGTILFGLSKTGLGGLMFFPKGLMHVIFKFDYFIQAFLLITVPALIVTAIPTFGLRHVKVVELLKGELSARGKHAGKQSKRDVIRNADNTFLLTLKLALRNVFANKRRNIVIFSLFTCVITLLYLFLAYSDGIVSNFRNGFQALNNPRSDIIATKTGYADVYKTNVNSDELKEMTVVDYEALRQSLLKIDGIKDVYAKTIPLNMDLFIKGARFKDLSFRGIDSSMLNFLTSKVDIIEGRMLKPEDKNGILINIVNKTDIKAQAGDKITVLGTDLFNHVISEDFTLIGYYKPKIDNPFLTALVFTDKSGFNAISGYLDNEVNFLNIDLKKGHSIEAEVNKLNQWARDNNLDLEFNDFGKVYVRNDEKYGAGKKIITIITYLVIFFVMIGIINMILVNLYDRRKEIGTYYCIGAEKPLLMRVYAIEILVINVAATFVGTIIGLGLQVFINSLKISSSNPGIQIVFGGNVLYMAYNLLTVIMLFVSVIFITLCISTIALRSSLKVPPVVALHEIEE